MATGSNFAGLLRAGKFVIGAEITPIRGVSDPTLGPKIETLKSWVDVFNITDNPMAKVHLSSWAVSLLVQAYGVEVVCQMTVRDRNRLALQSDLLGVASHGVKNFLCLSGDHTSLGDQPEAKPVYDIDSIQWLMMASRMRDTGTHVNGEPLEGALDIFIGAVANPFSEPFEYRLKRFAKKVTAGAQFIMTQAVFDFDLFKRWLEGIREAGLADSAYIIAGLLPVTSPQTLNYLQKRVPGMIVPEHLVKRLHQARDPEEEGLMVTAELFSQIRDLQGIHGVLFMSTKGAFLIPEILQVNGFNGKEQAAPPPRSLLSSGEGVGS